MLLLAIILLFKQNCHPYLHLLQHIPVTTKITGQLSPSAQRNTDEDGP